MLHCCSLVRAVCDLLTREICALVCIYLHCLKWWIWNLGSLCVSSWFWYLSMMKLQIHFSCSTRIWEGPQGIPSLNAHPQDTTFTVFKQPFSYLSLRCSMLHHSHTTLDELLLISCVWMCGAGLHYPQEEVLLWLKTTAHTRRPVTELRGSCKHFSV